jgi:hypothetical protein
MKSTSDKLVNLHTMKLFVNFNQELITYKEQNHQNSAKPKAHTMSNESESKKPTEQKSPNAIKLLKKFQEIMTNYQRDMNTKLKI